jgi:hypothetical protein
VSQSVNALVQLMHTEERQYTGYDRIATTVFVHQAAPVERCKSCGARESKLKAGHYVCAYCGGYL